jgi:UDP-GlcNAc:undecaprenyl-phosphate GlcNAc-1-phosphate transferase
MQTKSIAVLGLLLASSIISLTGQMDASVLQAGADRGGGLWPALLPLILPVAILALPLLDSILSYIRRTNRGQWWFKPDKEHLHHRLLRRGHSVVRADLIMYMWAAGVGYGVIAIGLFDSLWIRITVVGYLVIAIAVTFLPLRPKRTPDPTIQPESISDSPIGQ